MKKILGIDTGGTYTDAALLDASSKHILFKSKTPTTKQKLPICIERTFERIPKEYIPEISVVCLSTTLATNAIVENQGCKEGLILIGKRPKGMMPTDRYVLAEGLFDIKGRQKTPVNLEQIDDIIENFKDKVDAIAISGYASIRNPEHEMLIAERVRNRLNIPIVCAHELTSTLGFYERTVTADLNARLIPLLCGLIDSVLLVMERLHMNAPLMIVKGDGSLMTASCAKRKPIETVLSGPASSVMGGMFLSGCKDAFVIDIGGTTTDIANVRNGSLKIRDEGARVGKWYTHVRAAEIFTAGLGGDSRIFLNGKKEIQIGPQKSVPYCMAAEKHPRLIGELAKIYFDDSYRHFCHHDDEAFVLIKKYHKLPYTNDEELIIEILRYEPHTLHFLENHIHMPDLLTVLEKLVQEGVIARISLTPTDILHSEGVYNQWDPRISEIATAITAACLGVTRTVLAEMVLEKITEMLNCNLIQAAMYFDHKDFDVQNDPAVNYFLNNLYFHRDSQALQASYHINKKIVAIGAPSPVLTSALAEKMETEVIIPENAEVANAIGAAVGRSVEKIEILIRMDSVSGRYVAFAPNERKDFETLEEATNFSSEAGCLCIRNLSEERAFNLDVRFKDIRTNDQSDGSEHFIERIVIVRADFGNTFE
ncbi:MAG: hydantoinase/oxoprolinase family protein [Lachnospiraceae bacterium]|nr:hydantoinase/oxoprolinase family protein [Lachnospiraceae bacterium]MCI1327525.1 hydantoinase/oxoprolinase family protein [Lachnospiraceae bacterium]